jgi:hypothetical protein
MTSQISNTKIKIGATLVAALMATTALTSVMTATAPANAGQSVVVQTTYLAASLISLKKQDLPW